MHQHPDKPKQDFNQDSEQNGAPEPQMGQTPGPQKSHPIWTSKLYYVIAVLLIGTSFVGGYFTRDWVLATSEPVMNVSQTPSVPVASRPESNSSSSMSNAAEQEISIGDTTMTFSEFQAYVRDFDDDDPSIGPPDAPITVVEFSDFECPYCKRFRDETLTPLLNAYEGIVRFVYRDFPLSNIHPRAQIAAEAAECAHEQGKYWLMHDLLFADQSSWKRAPNVFDRFRFYAEQLRMDADQLVDCVSSGKFRQEVILDQQAAIAYGMRGTPSFLINGKLLRGAVSFEMFQQVLERELAALSEQATESPVNSGND